MIEENRARIITEEQIQKLLKDQKISEELQKIENSRYFVESHKRLVEKVNKMSGFIGKENDRLEILVQASKEDVKIGIIRQLFSKCTGNLNNIRKDMLKQLRNEEEVKKIIDQVNSEIEAAFIALIQQMAAIGYLSLKVLR